MRERVAFNSENTPLVLRDLLARGAANEAMILSTCNRTEFYTYAPDFLTFQQWLAHHPQLGTELQNINWYFYRDQEAVRHVMRVASGLDSMIIGEPQIFGQMKQAFALAHEAGAIGSQLQRLFQRVFSVTKQIRSETKIGVNPVSIAYAAAKLAQRIFAQLTKCSVLLIGAGQTIELAAMHLAGLGVHRIIVANRSVHKAVQVAERFHGHGISMADIPVYLPEADIVITATGSQLPILGKGMVERAIKTRKHKPILMVDLAVPRDIESEVAQLEDIYLYNVDDMRDVIQAGLKSREEATKHAEDIIEIQAQHFMHEIQALNAVDIIRAYREQVSQVRDNELDKAFLQLAKGQSPQVVLAEMGRSLTNKIMHVPTRQLYQAGFDGQLDMLITAKRLFNLE